MAPRGPRSGAGASTGGRETRSATRDSNKKTTTGAGIAKRRGGARVDNDGDLDMGSGSARGASAPAGDSKRGNRKSSNPRGGSKIAQNVMKHLSSGDASRLEGRVKDPSAAKAARAKIGRAHV